MRPRAPRPDSLQSVTVLEILEALDPQHGEAGVPFKDLEAAGGSRLSFQALKDALNALVAEGAVARVARSRPGSGSPAPDEPNSTVQIVKNGTSVPPC